MAVLHRVRTVITGASGAPYLSTMYFDGTAHDPADASLAVHTFWTGVKGAMVGGTAINIETEVAHIDSVTGTLLAATGVASAGMAGTAGGELLPRQAQLLIRWSTSAIVDGHRIKGRTFIPLLTEVANAAGGIPNSDVLNWAESAGTALIDDANTVFVIWRRPRPASPTKPARVGSFAEVVVANPWEQWATLNSRRD